MRPVSAKELAMRRFSVICLSAAALWFLPSCVTRATSTYPSYENTVARYSPPAKGVPLTDPAYATPDDCDCPRVWYRDHWVYHCDGEWIYWHHGYWYHYPNFHVYYNHGAPRGYRGGGRSIKKR